MIKLCIKNVLAVESPIALAMALAFAVSASAQTTQTTGIDGYVPTQIAPGSTASSYRLSNIFSVNYYTGNLHVDIPLIGVGGRGKANVNVGYVWDGARYLTDSYGFSSYCSNQNAACNVYAPAPVSPPPSITPLQQAFPNLYYGTGIMTVNYVNDVPQGIAVAGYAVTRLTYYRSDGTSTELVDANSYGQPVLTYCNPLVNNNTSQTACKNMYDRGRTFVSHDGSNLKFVSQADIYDYVTFNPASVTNPAPAGVLYFPDGTQLDTGKGTVEDSNGNVVTSASGLVTSALGQHVLIGAVSNPDKSTNATIQYTGYNGQTRKISVYTPASCTSELDAGFSQSTYAALWPTLFSETNPSDLQGTTPYCRLAASSITMPDSSTYQFRYNSYGELTRITLPAGGAYEFTWASLSSTYDGADLTFLQVHRGVTEIRYKPDGINVAAREDISYSSTASTSISTSGAISATSTEYDSAGNPQRRTVRSFYGPTLLYSVREPVGHDGWQEGRSYETDLYTPDPNSSGGWKLLNKTAHNWQQEGVIPWSDTGNRYYGSGANQIAYNPRDVQVDTTVDGGLVSQVSFQYDQYNNVTDKKEYDWGSGGSGVPGSLVRETISDYVTNSAYVSMNVVSLPSDLRIYAGSALSALTYYNYDETAPVDAPGIVGHDTSFGVGQNTRGNLTTRMSWFGGTTNYVFERYAYDIAGNVKTVQDGNGNTYTLNYADNYSDGQSRNTYAHVTTMTNPYQQTETWQWDFNTGKYTQATDPNGVSTVYSFSDPLDRLTQIRKAAGIAGTESQTNVAYTSPTDVNVYSDLTATGQGGLHSESLYDGFGRVT